MTSTSTMMRGAPVRIRITQADLDDRKDQEAVLKLVEAYASDPMGGGAPLSNEASARLLPGLREHPTTLILLARAGARPVGIAVCFRGFSTFAAAPLINIHDLAVLPEFRGKGIGRALLRAVERKARQMRCCKLTLEVKEENKRARALYDAAGFSPILHQEQGGSCLFLSKRL